MILNRQIKTKFLAGSGVDIGDKQVFLNKSRGNRRKREEEHTP